MAEDEGHAVERHLGIVLHAFPCGISDRGFAIVVADDEMLTTFELREQIRDSVQLRAEREIPEMPDLVVARHELVPPCYERRIMQGD